MKKYHANSHSYGKNRPAVSRKKFNGPRKKGPKKLDAQLFINEQVASSVQPQHVAKISFADFVIPEVLKQNIQKHGYILPTEIQEQAIPPLLENRDVIGIANTGTGKTAAFLIPLVAKLLKNPQERVVIITPTREIAMQILDELHIFAQNTNLSSTLCIGGANIKRQEKNLSHKPSFVIGTPGRLKDLVQRKKLFLHQFNSVVLDEVDRMVDIGFIRDIKLLISFLPEKRQSLFFSATINAQVREILATFVHDPVNISVKKQETSVNISQNIVKVTNPTQKIEQLHDLLTQDGFDKVLVFGRTKWGVEKLTKNLLTRGFRVASIHGNKSQGQRARALKQFKDNEIQVLLATDVASRGLDIDNVTHVINYDAPDSYEDYVHRIGRTGRSNKTGYALTFVE